MSPAPLMLVVTGAAGFLGRRTVARALARGHEVRALGRSAERLAAQPWSGEAQVETIAADLAQDAAEAALDRALDGAMAVIHAAAALGGDDAAHARDTVGPTRRLIAALLRRREAGGRVPRLVLVSSLAVYGYAALPDGALLDETAPPEPDPHLRDAYCRAKLAQEALVREAARTEGLEARLLRPGAIFGPGRLRTARLGVALGPLLLMPGGRAAIPAVHVDSCAEALVLAAERPLAAPTHDEPAEAINVIDDHPPTQAEYAEALRPSGWPRRVLPLPRRPLSVAASAVSLGGELLGPGVVRPLPGLVRSENFEARFKPLRYANARLRSRLGRVATRPFAEAMRASLEETGA